MIIADRRGLEFEPLGQGAWRLCDTSAAEESAERLVAYVEQTEAGSYEAIWIGPGPRTSLHATREEIQQTAEALRRAEPVHTSAKPNSIPHRAPSLAAPARQLHPH